MSTTWHSRRWRVYCSQWVQCGWKGYRTADAREGAIAKPCPKCEHPVSA